MTDQLEVDVTGWVITRLGGILVARVGSKMPADLANQLPFVRVVRSGGPDDGYAIDFPTVVFHCFAATDEEANTLGYGVAAALRGIVGVPADGAVMGRPRKIGGPTWAAYENTAVSHSVLTMQLPIKATG